MRELHGTATEMVAARREDCLALVAAVDRYPAWCPEVVRGVEVLERNQRGEPSKVRTKLHVSRGPITKDFDLTMAVTVDRPTTVKLSRVRDNASSARFDVTWHLERENPTRVELDLGADLRVPRFLPLGGIGDSLAQTFVRAAGRAVTADSPPS